MQWFLERISARSLPIQFGIRERREHLDDFEKLIRKKILVRAANLDAVDCTLCGEDHQCQVREEDGALFFICENGCGRQELTDDDVAIFEYDNAAFLHLLATEFGLKTNDGSIKDEADYATDAFYRLGTYKDKKVKATVYYLRTGDLHEPSSFFENASNSPKVLITNTAEPNLVHGKEGTRYCILADALVPTANKEIFYKMGIVRCFDDVRRVQFDKKNGHLSLDGKRIYTAALESPQYYFLLYLWDNWMKQVPHGDIHYFVRGKMGKQVADDSQKDCQKIKGEIKQKCKKIDEVISVPTVGHYMMADPV
ncbi:hypothetical protein FBR07_02600 [Candidatus Uhrbacteria bacterium UHB]|nr:hypothetical protein [Candidatus Uhrbacteria bacterium UHB]RIL00166.1 MAG: hypothetical protein DCC77_04760 [Candidatus Uhrbacteria bacterium]